MNISNLQAVKSGHSVGFALAVDTICPILDGVLRPIGEAYDEIDLCKGMDDWSQTL